MKKNKELAVKLIKEKLSKNGFMTYNEIANATGYHPKYILNLKKEIQDKTISIEHGNKNKSSLKAVPKSEEEKIVNLYRRSHASINKFCHFYSKRSYSCIYGILKKNGLIKKRNC